jgi:hypothetical protein
VPSSFRLTLQPQAAKRRQSITNANKKVLSGKPSALDHCLSFAVALVQARGIRSSNLRRKMSSTHFKL